MLFKKILRYLLPVLRIQLFISLVALPILVYWGLAISALSIFGNIIFAPLLTVFLLVSSLIFFLEVLCLPNSWLIYLLEKITQLWLNLSPPCHKIYLLNFPKITWMLFLGALFLAIYVISYLKINQLKQVLLLSLILLTSTWLAKRSFWITTNQIELKHRRASMLIMYQKNGSLIIHDHGVLNQRYGLHNWLCYKLLPAIIQNFGTITVQELHLNKTNQFTDQNLSIFKQNIYLKNNPINHLN